MSWQQEIIYTKRGMETLYRLTAKTSTKQAAAVYKQLLFKKKITAARRPIWKQVPIEQNWLIIYTQLKYCWKQAQVIDHIFSCIPVTLLAPTT